MKTTIIQDNQRGLLIKHGRFMRLLEPGKYRLFGDTRVEVLELNQPLTSDSCTLETLLACPEISKQTASVQVADQQLALHFVDGIFAEALSKGQHAFWSIQHSHTFQLVSIATPEVAPDVPRYIFSRLPSVYYVKVEVSPYDRARLYFDRKLVGVLEPGTYYYWRCSVQVQADFVDTRLTSMTVTGQELLTQDKVSLRISYVYSYRITDYVRIALEINDFKEQLHVAAQLALRDYVGMHPLYEILESKEELSDYVTGRLREKAEKLFVEITDGGVKDIILPGEIRDIMNTVLVAQKRAQASVITRREEVASTRSLLNTAKLMDENRTLYKLKELESIERICSNVGSISLSGGSDLLTQLAGLLQGEK